MSAASDESVFAAARAFVNPAERAAYLDRVCAQKPALRAEVEGLLATFAASNPLDRPPGPLVATGTYEAGSRDTHDAGPARSSGDRIGP